MHGYRRHLRGRSPTPVVNLSETFIGLTIASFVIALLMLLLGRRRIARRWALAGGALGIVAAALETYIRWAT